VSHQTLGKQVTKVAVVTRARRSDHEDVARLGLFDCHVNGPVVTRCNRAGQRIACDLGRDYWAKTVVEKTDAPLSFVHSGNAKFGKTIDN
jgi:hypothetical protein